MPGRDQTGPIGNGPNGRALGPCRDEKPNSSQERAFFGIGRGGRRRWWGKPLRSWRNLGNDQESLEAEERFLEKRLKDVRSQLNK